MKGVASEPKNMPKKTFFNLPEEKRQAIIDAAYDIFIEHDYKDINIRMLAKAFHISLGSFYQYFDDKDELYLYLVTAVEKKIYAKEIEMFGNYFSRRDAIPLEQICTPKEIALDDTWLHVPIEVLQKFYFGPYTKELHQGLLEEMQELKEKGLIKEWVDLDLLFHIYTTTMFNFLIYFREKGITDREEQLETKLNFFFDILNYGIRPMDSALELRPECLSCSKTKK